MLLNIRPENIELTTYCNPLKSHQSAMDYDERQDQRPSVPAPIIGRRNLITPNPKLKVLDQVREVMRLKHYSIRTETAYCDWIKRYVKFHSLRLREDLQPAEAKMELFLSDLAVNGKVAASSRIWISA